MPLLVFHADVHKHTLEFWLILKCELSSFSISLIPWLAFGGSVTTYNNRGFVTKPGDVT